MGICCSQCFKEKYISGYIEKNGDIEDCEYCGTKSIRACDTADIGALVRSGLRRAYENINEEGVPREADEGESVSDIINHHQYLFSEDLYNTFNDERLLNDLLTDSGIGYTEHKNGIDDWLEEGEAHLIPKSTFFGPDNNQYSLSWEKFKRHIKHYLRFFDPDTETTRAALIGPIFDLLKNVQITLPVNTALWRVREPDDSSPATDDPIQLQNAIGPAPVEKSGHGRMNPAGISYIYLSDSPETCASELNVKHGSTIWAGKFKITKELRLVDLSRIPDIEIGSIFDPNYDHNKYWAKGFFEEFTSEISQPIQRKEFPLEYIPTQLLSEFIRIKGFDGLKYESSQRPGSYNYTFFLGPNEYGYPYNFLPPNSIPAFSNYMHLECFRHAKVSRLNVEMKLEIEKEHKFNQKLFDNPKVLEVQKLRIKEYTNGYTKKRIF